MNWSTDRRGFLKAAGLLASLTAAPRFAWAADGKVLRIRPEGPLVASTVDIGVAEAAEDRLGTRLQFAGRERHRSRTERCGGICRQRGGQRGDHLADVA